MNPSPKIITITDRMHLVHRLSAERAAERVHRADSILDDAFLLALCDCKYCRDERIRMLVVGAQERRIAEENKREWLKRWAWRAVVGLAVVLAAWAVLA